MNVKKFRERIWQAKDIIISGRGYPLKEIVRFNFDDGNFYIKCFLEDGYVFADDESTDSFLLVAEVETPFTEPFPKQLEYNGKKFEFVFDAHAVARETKGEEIFKIGDAERFWDYKAVDGSYLSLGMNDKTGQRLDFYGRIVGASQVGLE
jgi:hypothetical protein